MDKAIATLGRDYPDLEPVLPEVQAVLERLHSVFASGHRLYICGNGGSAADSDHIVGELCKGFLKKRPLPPKLKTELRDAYGNNGCYLAENLQGALPAYSLSSHTALATAFANDVAPDLVFAQQIHAYGTEGDALISISTSGNSINVLHATRLAKTQGMHTIALTGSPPGELSSLCELSICVPQRSTPAVQERHLPIYHALCIALEERLF